MRRIARFFQRFPILLTIGWHVWRLRQPKFTAGAVGVVFDAQGRILLVEHVLHAHTPWGLPGGWVDRNEAPDQTVRRELREELALTVTTADLVCVDVVYRYHMDFGYVCAIDGAIGTLSRELLGYQWYTVDTLPRLLPFHQKVVEAALAFRRSHPAGG